MQNAVCEALSRRSRIIRNDKLKAVISGMKDSPKRHWFGICLSVIWIRICKQTEEKEKSPMTWKGRKTTYCRVETFNTWRQDTFFCIWMAARFYCNLIISFFFKFFMRKFRLSVLNFGRWGVITDLSSVCSNNQR